MDDWHDQLAFDGYTMLHGVLSAADVESARRWCPRALAGDGVTGSVLANQQGTAYGARTTCCNSGLR